MAKDLLTDAKLRASKPAEKPFKLSDGGGLFLLVQPGGASLAQTWVSAIDNTLPTRPVVVTSFFEGEYRASGKRFVLLERGLEIPCSISVYCGPKLIVLKHGVELRIGKGRQPTGQFFKPFHIWQ